MPLKDQYSTNLGLSDIPEFDSNKYPELWSDALRVRNALRVLQGTLDIYTGALSEDPQYWNVTPARLSARVQNISRVYAQAATNISVAQVVLLYGIGSQLTAQKANASDNTKPCRAFCSSPAGVLSGAFGEFTLLGVNPYYGGLTVGKLYYLNTVDGQITSIIPTTSGNIVQPVGYALSATELWFTPSLTYTTAP